MPNASCSYNRKEKINKCVKEHEKKKKKERECSVNKTNQKNLTRKKSTKNKKHGTNHKKIKIIMIAIKKKERKVK